MTQQKLFYAAHAEGTYPTAWDALASTGVDADRITAAIVSSNEYVILDFGPYHAVVTPEFATGEWTLWRAFIRDAGASEAEAREFIKRFPPDLQRDKWAIFEYAETVHVMH